MAKNKPDRNFDGIARKFERNIYGTTKGQLRHQLLLHQLTPWLAEQSQLNVIDVGGGTGEMASALVQQGHRVLLNDLSAEALNVAKQKFSASDPIEFHHGDFTALSKQGKTADLVVCHAVLEWTKNPAEVVTHLSSLLAENGQLSLSFFNRDAAIFSNALYGNFDYLERGMQVKKQVKLNPQNPLDPRHVLAWLKDNQLTILASAGVRCFHDYLRDREHQVTKYEQLLSLEKRLGEQSPYKWLGRYFHIIAQRTTTQ